VTEIERRIEVPAHQVEPDYAGMEISEERRAKGFHRAFVGGQWDEMGRLQLDYLISQGLEPGQLFLDVGCGALRAGRLLSDYLEPGHYYGVDVNNDVITTGYDQELTDEQRSRLPVSNLHSTDRFDCDFGVRFDMAIAQSVFTHISLNLMRLCLYRVAKVMKPGGRFYVTFFERRPTFELDTIQDNRLAFTERNRFWYYRSDMEWVASNMPWEFTYIGDWDHPRNQKMVVYTRQED
jgi:SAM-dependent methyltransferase